jgi:opacity protein-like surface antigen
MKHLLLTLTLTGLLISCAFAADVAGVKLPDQVEISGQQLQLNGYGIRKKYFFKIYVGSLYTAQKATSAAQVVDGAGAKLLRMNFLYSKVEKEKIVGGFAEGIKKNSPALSNDPAVVQFLALFDADFIEKDQVDLAISADNQVKVSHNGRVLGTIASANLAKAILLIYLGEKPADDDMKAGMLGDI